MFTDSEELENLSVIVGFPSYIQPILQRVYRTYDILNDAFFYNLIYNQRIFMR